MRRHGELFARVTSFENLYLAAREVFRGKRDRPAAGALFFDLEGELLRLQRELEARAYQPGAYHSFWIQDPKRRLISAAPLRDRVVHHAVVRVIEPIFERRFISHSYACRRGKGTHRALRQFVSWARSHRYVLKLDVRKFFPSIDHQVLKAQVRRAIKDPGVLWLLDAIIDSSNPQEPVPRYFPGDDLWTPSERRVGLPIGNLTSQFLANVLLDALDHEVKDRLRVRGYLRYVDDVCAFGDDKARLRELRAAVRETLLALRLRLNEHKSRLRRVEEGIGFLGFVVTPEHLRLAPTAVRRQRRRSRRWAGPEAIASVEAWQAHALQGSTRALVLRVLRRWRGSHGCGEDVRFAARPGILGP